MKQTVAASGISERTSYCGLDRHRCGDRQLVGRSALSCHRLQRKGASGIPLHLVRTDIAGNISKRFSLSGIHIPRHSGACPRWNIYSAFMAPDRINIQLSQMPDGQRYFCIARTIAKGDHRYNVA